MNEINTSSCEEIAFDYSQINQYAIDSFGGNKKDALFNLQPTIDPLQPWVFLHITLTNIYSSQSSI